MGYEAAYRETCEGAETVLINARDWATSGELNRARVFYEYAGERLKIFAERNPDYRGKVDSQLEQIREEMKTRGLPELVVKQQPLTEVKPEQREQPAQAEELALFKD